MIDEDVTFEKIRPPTRHRHRPKQVCHRKTRYSNPHTAHEVSRRTFFRYGHDLDVYYCHLCGTWHLGHRFDRSRVGRFFKGREQ